MLPCKLQPIAAVLGTMSVGVLAFTPPAHNISPLDAPAILLHSSNGDADFDPFLQSPHSFGGDDSGTSTNSDAESDGETTFGFLSYTESSAAINTIEASEGSQTNTDLEFDPLLSPHAYANGADAAPVDITESISTQQKIGILLIDHGSKRQASNDHIHNIAQLYENRLQRGGSTSKTTTTIVRAAHMEISKPNIEESLRSIIADDEVTQVVCVPYFLSPGRHATEDVPNLIEEAKAILRDEGLLLDPSSILVSNALGTHMESMLGALDDLVDWTLNEG